MRYAIYKSGYLHFIGIDLFKESNSLLKDCATQTHVWEPRDHSLHRRPLGELLVFEQQNLVATKLYNQLSARSADDYLVYITNTLKIQQMHIVTKKYSTNVFIV